MLRATANTLFLAVVLVPLCAAPLRAQSDGKIVGVVRDSSGGVVPGVTVTVTNQQTGTNQVVTTGGEGTYQVAGLAGGAYTVSAVLPGFRKVTQKDQQVTAGGSITANFTLVALLAEEITVTAMKREDTIGNTPFSVAAPTAEVLRAQGIEDIEGVAATVGGLEVQNLGPGQSQVAVRGVSSGQIQRDQPGVKEQVGFYLDESPVSLSIFTPDLDFFDMSRVEVLRGPQGTLFGAGSESGTVRYITNQPVLGLTKWSAEFGGNVLTGGGAGGDIKLGANVPLGNTAAMRISGYYDKLAGFIDAVQPNLSINKNVNSGYKTGGRVAIKIAPNDNLTITPRVIYQYTSTDGENREDVYNILANPFTTTRPAVTLGPLQQFTQTGEPFTDKFVVGDLNIRYNFGGATLTSITSYTYRDILVVRDATALTASITGGSIGLPEKDYTITAPLDDATTSKSFTQEIRLSGEQAHFQWVLGGFYAHNTRDYSQNLNVLNFTQISGVPSQTTIAPENDLFYSKLGYTLNQEAAFGEGTWTANDRFKLVAGLRYYHYNEDKAQVFDGIFGDGSNGLPVSQPGTVTANGVAPRVIASYKVADSSTLDAQVSKGFRLGGINDPLNFPLCSPQDLITFGGHTNWLDETTWNYELDSKSTLWGGKGSFNIAAFYEDIKNLQATVTAGTCSSRVIFNVPKSRSVGADVEFEAAPTRNFDLSISGSYTDAVLQSTLTSTSAAGTVIVAGIEDGARLPTVPQLQFSAAATYQWQVKEGSIAYITAINQYKGSRYTQVGDQLAGTLSLLVYGAHSIGGPPSATTFNFNPLLPAYDLVNLRVGVRHGRWDASLYCNNLTNELALLSLDRERGFDARIGYYVNPPRTFGFQVRIN
jgi:iron complex outermembrane receptor protein